jgi:hypothetical protein
VVGRLERLESEQGKRGVEPSPLALYDCIISFVLQSTKPPHGDNTAFFIPFGVRAVRVTSDVDGVDRVIHCNGYLDFRSFDGIC